MEPDARFKSLFVTPAIVGSGLLAVGSLVMAVIDDVQRTAWLGAAITGVPMPLLTARLLSKPVPRTSENLPVFLLITAIGMLIAFWQQFIEEISGWAPTSVALGGSVIFLLYVFWFSRFGRFDSPKLGVGGKLPVFSAWSADGSAFDSTTLAGTPAILLFYRGNWCPFCMAQINEIAARYQDLDRMGIRVVLISPQPDEMSRSLAADLDVPFDFVVDRDNAVAKELGIALRNGVPMGISGYEPGTVMPTVVVINGNGTILYADQTDNYRVRPEPDIFLAILRRSGAVAT